MSAFNFAPTIRRRAMDQGVIQAIRVFFTNATNSNISFDMGDIYDYVVGEMPGRITLKEVSDCLQYLEGRKEVAWEVLDGKCTAKKPECGGVAVGSKVAAFTKKQKQAALDALKCLPPDTLSCNQSLTPLIRWLEGQLSK